MQVPPARVATAVFGAALLAASPARSEPAGNIDLNVFRPAIDSRGYLTVNASQVLGNKELSFGLGALDWGHRLLHFESGSNTYDVQNVVTATLIAAFGLNAGPAQLERRAAAPLEIVAWDL